MIFVYAGDVSKAKEVTSGTRVKNCILYQLSGYAVENDFLQDVYFTKIMFLLEDYLGRKQ